MHGPTPLIFDLSGFSAVVTCWPLEVQVILFFRVLSWWPLSSSVPLTRSFHCIGVLISSGVYFWCHPGSWFIVCVHCRGFNHTYLEMRLLDASLASPVLRGCLFSGIFRTHHDLFHRCRYLFWSSECPRSYQTLFLLLFDWWLLLVLSLLCINGGEEIKF